MKPYSRRDCHNFTGPSYVQEIRFQRNFRPKADLGQQSKKMKRLSELQPGTIARIHSFEKNDLFLKLMEMGCVPGELVKVEQVAPLGDPISITVSGYNLSLRLDEAENIFMEEGIK
jgi:ferrous iron transport protein A